MSKVKYQRTDWSQTSCMSCQPITFRINHERNMKKRVFIEGPPRHLSKFAQIIMTFNYSFVKMGFSKEKRRALLMMIAFYCVWLSGSTKVIRKILNLWTLSSIFGVRNIIVISVSSVFYHKYYQEKVNVITEGLN